MSLILFLQDVKKASLKSMKSEDTEEDIKL